MGRIRACAETPVEPVREIPKQDGTAAAISYSNNRHDFDVPQNRGYRSLYVAYVFGIKYGSSLEHISDSDL